MVEWLDQQIVPVLDNQPSLIVLDLFGGHKTDGVLDTLYANDITVSIIPGGCTGLIQPLDISINRPFKDILKVRSVYTYSILYDPSTRAPLYSSLSVMKLKKNSAAINISCNTGN
jgi:hypothetical protein